MPWRAGPEQHAQAARDPALRDRGIGPVTWNRRGAVHRICDVVRRCAAGAASSSARRRCALPRYTLADLPERIDYVLINHGHNARIRPETLLRLRNRIGPLVVPHNAGRRLQDPSLKLMPQALGFERVIALHEFERIVLADGAITALPLLGEHNDLGIQDKAGYHVRIEGRSAAC
ncbi:MBL fold metallo-hydrolase [Xanthomonas translucens]|uniref:MBL fold metallo-hydrolase n=1 Tax=Xanthomonas campestris pv. translucens TaxID=343 RepID=UPI000B2E0914|nr:MBL fold metallo-hydrolase [Xanthomonas translucens]MCT8272145.1 MBL fold metallo-hydrolase [Xanthomonas translucens pv. undulosa]MCT8283598.1 MBL fold metallo-hydrolase [Xanthomonas translucens pv. undulosa]MCT8318350.1 MBL fold metallo-hydrolase [Xanthomonas translucens pv. undulosa]WNJ31234.1 MBL fold metallo-hydrolase [Xanthomonas translucens pv. undulosa]